MTNIDMSCAASFLAFRYVVDREKEWIPGCKPWWPDLCNKPKIKIKDEHQVLLALLEFFRNHDGHTGILLSGGIDSAILARFLPKGTPAFTVKFDSPNSINEVPQANKYSSFLGLDHQVVNTGWQDYEVLPEALMKHKKAPLHPVEVPLYKASLHAKKCGIERLIVGNAADSIFGGFDKLLAKDWTFNEFIKRYTFVDPDEVLESQTDVSAVFTHYRQGEGIDVQRFLKKVHADGLVQAFSNAAECAGIEFIQPYALMEYDCPIDLEKIRNGESKYLLRSLFKILYPGFEIPEKIPFSRPMDEWLMNYEHPSSYIFRNDVNIGAYTGDQKWLIYILDSFVNLLQKNLI